jgi:hypothetical protein
MVINICEKIVYEGIAHFFIDDVSTNYIQISLPERWIFVLEGYNELVWSHEYGEYKDYIPCGRYSYSKLANMIYCHMNKIDKHNTYSLFYKGGLCKIYGTHEFSIYSCVLSNICESKMFHSLHVKPLELMINKDKGYISHMNNLIYTNIEGNLEILLFTFNHIVCNFEKDIITLKFN